MHYVLVEHGMVVYGMVKYSSKRMWYGYGIVWYEYGMVKYIPGMIETVQKSAVWFCMVWHSTVEHDTVW